MNLPDTTLRRRRLRSLTRWVDQPCRLLVSAILGAVLAQAATAVAPDDALPPRPANHIVGEVAALTPAESEQLESLLAEAADRDDTHLYVVLMKKGLPVPSAEYFRALLSDWSEGWLTGVIVCSTEANDPPIVQLSGPGEAAIGAVALREAARRVQESATREGSPGAQALRCVADLLDELRQLRASAGAPGSGGPDHPPESTPIGRWASAPLSWLLAAPLIAGLLLVGVLSVRRLPSGPLSFPDAPYRERLAAPYAGGSAVCVNFAERDRRSG